MCGCVFVCVCSSVCVCVCVRACVCVCGGLQVPKKMGVAEREREVELWRCRRT